MAWATCEALVYVLYIIYSILTKSYEIAIIIICFI